MGRLAGNDGSLGIRGAGSQLSMKGPKCGKGRLTGINRDEYLVGSLLRSILIRIGCVLEDENKNIVAEFNPMIEKFLQADRKSKTFVHIYVFLIETEVSPRGPKVEENLRPFIHQLDLIA